MTKSECKIANLNFMAVAKNSFQNLMIKYDMLHVQLLRRLNIIHIKLVGIKHNQPHKKSYYTNNNIFAKFTYHKITVWLDHILIHWSVAGGLLMNC